MTQSPQFPEGTEEKMLKLLKQAKTASEVRRIQSILFVVQKTKTENISKMVSFTEDYIRRIWIRYRLEGDHFLLGEKRGSGRGKAHLTLEEEKKFLAPFIGKAKKSGMLIVSEVHKAHKEKLGKEKMHHSVTYNLLHRHGWRKIVPRPSHPKSDTEAQEKFRTFFPPEDKKSTMEGKKKKSKL